MNKAQISELRRGTFSIEQSLDSQLSSMNTATALVHQWYRSTGCSPDILDNVIVCCFEAIQNAVIHGNKYDENKKVNFSLLDTGKQLIMSVEDQGPGYDPKSLDDPCCDNNIETENGRGLFIIDQLTDYYTLENDGRRVKMCFEISSS